MNIGDINNNFLISSPRPIRPSAPPVAAPIQEDHGDAALEEFLAGWVSEPSTKAPSLDAMIKLQQATTPDLPPAAAPRVQNSEDHALRQIESLVRANPKIFTQPNRGMTDGWNIAGMR